MKILLTNDDGYTAPGILALHQTLKPHHEVTLVAPDRENSGVGHAISLNQPMRLEEKALPCGSPAFAVTGTPADCVKLALFELFPGEAVPDLVIAGINPGSNTGVNINYSGTAAAAREAVINGVPAIAASIEIGARQCLDFEGFAQFIATLVDKLPGMGIPGGTFLNLNAPDRMIHEARGVAITRQCTGNVSKEFSKRTDPKNREYFWYGGAYVPEGETDTDIQAVGRDRISISPIQCDTTDHDSLDSLRVLESS